MFANRILVVLVGIMSLVIIPVQLITTFVLGLLVSLSFGLLLLPFSLVWILLLFPMVGASWLTSKIEWLRNPIGLLGIPWAIVATTFNALVPHMGDIESRATKHMLAESWPYSWECWKFQDGKADLYDPESAALREVIERISLNNPVMQRTVDQIAERGLIARLSESDSL